MMAACIVLRVQFRARKISRFWAAFLAVGFGLLILLWRTPTKADPPPLPPPVNMAPVITNFHAEYVASGWYSVMGRVSDDQDPTGLMVEVWGGAMGGDG